MSPIAGSATIHYGGYLTTDGCDAIKRFMDDRGFGNRIGEIMKLVGRKLLDASLGMAMSQSAKLKSDLIADLEALLRTNG